MSQAGVLVPGGTPSIASNYVTDDGTAIPVANTLNIIGGETSIDNDNGIQTAATPHGGDTVTIELTNRITAAVTTTDASDVDALIFDCGTTKATYAFSGTVVGYNTTVPGSFVTDFNFAARTDGTIVNEYAGNFSNTFIEASMSSAAVFIAQGGTDVVIQVRGIVAQDIDWSILMEYRRVS